MATEVEGSSPAAAAATKSGIEDVGKISFLQLCAGVAVVNGKIYVLGGEEGWDRYHDTIECYDPVPKL